MRYVYAIVRAAFLLTLLLVVLCLGATDTQAGPIRQFVRDHRPGVIIPKRPCPPAQPRAGCACGTSCTCTTGTRPVQGPTCAPPAVYSPVYALPAPYFGGSCPGGVCPAPCR